MKKKTFIVLIMTFVLSLLCFGCNSTNNANDEDSTSSSEEMKESNITLTLNVMDEIVYPYIDVVRAYLEAGADADVNDYEFHVPLQAKPITISWNLQGGNAENYLLEIATKSDYSNAKKVLVSGVENSYDIKYLLRDTKYYVRLSLPNYSSVKAETTFKTTYLGPRFLDVGGLYNNCRDLGGYTVGDKTILYNMVIRGSSPDNNYNKDYQSFTEEGIDFITNEIKLRTQLDLRGSSENCGRYSSSFANANYIQVPLTAYTACFTSAQASLYRDAFRVFADTYNYPVYFHCSGGADRTGTVAALLLAYLGVSKEEIIQDYVVTTFSPVCYEQNARSRENIVSVLDGLDKYYGETLSEKCKSYLTSIGLTQKELYSIKAIMFGENPDDYVKTVDYGVSTTSRYYETKSLEDYQFSLNDNLIVTDVQIDDKSVQFEQSIKSVSIKASALSEISAGLHTINVIFSDGKQTNFSISVDMIDITGELQVTQISNSAELTYVTIKASSSIFTGVDWHFHTRNDSIFPNVEPNVKINGRTISDINSTTNLSDSIWTEAPASTDARHRVPVDIYATGDTLKLVIRSDWLQSYLSGNELVITICGGLEYTLDNKTYKVLTDINYRYTNSVWIKV